MRSGRHPMQPQLLLLACCFAAAAAGALQLASAQPIKKVDVDLFVMSKCPDAVFCESYLAPLLDEMKYFINLRFHYIGEKQPDGSWGCKHGDDECAGNLQGLCVQQFSADYNRVNWLLHFILCTNAEGMESIGKFATAAKCLKEVGAPVVAGTKMMSCIYSPGSRAVLDSDFAQTAALGVTTSCTIRLDGNDVCVRDGGEWRDCPGGTELADFKTLLCGAIAMKSEGHVPAACKGVGPPPALPGSRHSSARPAALVVA